MAILDPADQSRMIQDLEARLYKLERKPEPKIPKLFSDLTDVSARVGGPDEPDDGDAPLWDASRQLYVPGPAGGGSTVSYAVISADYTGDALTLDYASEDCVGVATVTNTSPIIDNWIHVNPGFSGLWVIHANLMFNSAGYDESVILKGTYGSEVFGESRRIAVDDDGISAPLTAGTLAILDQSTPLKFSCDARSVWTLRVSMARLRPIAEDEDPGGGPEDPPPPGP